MSVAHDDYGNDQYTGHDVEHLVDQYESASESPAALAAELDRLSSGEVDLFEDPSTLAPPTPFISTDPSGRDADVLAAITEADQYDDPSGYTVNVAPDSEDTEPEDEDPDAVRRRGTAINPEAEAQHLLDHGIYGCRWDQDLALTQGCHLRYLAYYNVGAISVPHAFAPEDD